MQYDFIWLIIVFILIGLGAWLIDEIMGMDDKDKIPKDFITPAERVNTKKENPWL